MGALVEALLAEQGELRAVERFAQFHEALTEPIQRPYYTALLPARPPGPGQQYAFEVDLDRCSGCKACVPACHALNGLDVGESWREVGLLVGGPPALPVLQHVTSSCHHCLEPACLIACPVDAYEKDPLTGIVRHLDDQCFGCQYCTLACPYDAPKFHPGKGIVRKCDMCGDRLREGEAPACVQACPHEAIRIRVVDVAEIAARAEAGEFLAGAPAPDQTQPTTRYRTCRPQLVDLRPVDLPRVVPEPAHAPLVVMLVLTQLSVGGFALDGLLVSGRNGHILTCLLALAFGLLGLAASLAHLGRPQFAYRAIIGLRHSWLSREVLALGGFAKLAMACVALEMMRPSWYASRPVLAPALQGAVVLAGLLGVSCSAMVYHATRRPFWRVGQAGVKFAMTAGVLGLATVLVARAWSGEPIRGLSVLLAALIAAKLAFEARIFRHRRDAGMGPWRRSALLMLGPLAGVTRWRFALGALAIAVLAVASCLGGPPAARLVAVAFPASVAGELCERFLFFAAVAKPRMPGGTVS